MKRAFGYLVNWVWATAVRLGLLDSPSLQSAGMNARDFYALIYHDGVGWASKRDMARPAPVPPQVSAPVRMAVMFAVRVNTEKAMNEFMRLARNGLPINPYYLSELIEVDGPKGMPLPTVEFHMPTCGCGAELNVVQCPECAIASREDCPHCEGAGAWLECPNCQEGDE